MKKKRCKYTIVITDKQSEFLKKKCISNSILLKRLLDIKIEEDGDLVIE